MTPESQRIAIAEACGWNYILLAGGRERCWFGSPERISGYRQDSVSMEHKTEWNGSQILGGIKTLPDYLTDLNAMHEAEKVLSIEQSQHYAGWLEGLCGPLTAQLCKATMDPNGNADYRTLFLIVHASAAQRSEAFLRAIGKWDDSK